jgi:1-aminocyclopropane-1-carboxylate deaminase
MHLDTPIPINEIDLAPFGQGSSKLCIARLDKIHPVVSGNKMFKLHYFLEEALAASLHSLVSFGGAYSNHLVAMAFAGRQKGLNTLGIVRGEAPAKLSHTLLACKEFGMQLQFLPRVQYREMQAPSALSILRSKHPGALIIPEGGYHPMGAKGASIIMEKLQHVRPTHICTAVGTATTIAGILRGAGQAEVIGIPVIKNMHDMEQRLAYLNPGITQSPVTWDEFHFGGYAKTQPALLEFMNRFFRETGVPTDIIYTGKMMFAVMDKINSGYFPLGSTILCLHTGGLQGNKSLEGEELIF